MTYNRVLLSFVVGGIALFCSESSACAGDRAGKLDLAYQSLAKERKLISMRWEGASGLSSEGERVYLIISDGDVRYFDLNLAGATGSERWRVYSDGLGSFLYEKPGASVPNETAPIVKVNRRYACAGDSSESHAAILKKVAYLKQRLHTFGVSLHKD